MQAAVSDSRLGNATCAKPPLYKLATPQVNVKHAQRHERNAMGCTICNDHRGTFRSVLTSCCKIVNFYALNEYQDMCHSTWQNLIKAGPCLAQTMAWQLDRDHPATTSCTFQSSHNKRSCRSLSLTHLRETMYSKAYSSLLDRNAASQRRSHTVLSGNAASNGHARYQGLVTKVYLSQRTCKKARSNFELLLISLNLCTTLQKILYKQTLAGHMCVPVAWVQQELS